MRAGFDTKVATFETAVLAYSTLQSHAPELHKVLDEKAKAIRTALQSMKTLLPVFFPDPAIVGEFGLAGEIKLDNDDLYVKGQACLAHWGEVSADPDYASVITDFAELQVVFDEFVAARADWITSDQALDEAQNTILTERANVEEQERDLLIIISQSIPRATTSFGRRRRGERHRSRAVAGKNFRRRRTLDWSFSTRICGFFGMPSRARRCYRHRNRRKSARAGEHRCNVECRMA